ncbi:MAG: carboxylesterase family protein [Bacteroidetes bacterium]|nr:carboxylesterase family protein [Bacteroidota bacterium]
MTNLPSHPCYRLCALVALFLGSLLPASAQRYLQPVMTQVQTLNGINYGQAVASNGTNQTLAMDLYLPVEANAAPRPVMLFFHGGSFVGGTRNDVVMTRLCQEFARRGYVTATASYRLGVSIGISTPLDAEFAKAAIRATQDAKAAVRFLRRSVADGVPGQSGLNPFVIDTNQIFIGGYSAGAITALHAAYFRDTALATPLIRNMLRVVGGGLEGLSGNPGYSSRVHGVFNMAGALLDSQLLQAPVHPTVHFHGMQDDVVPYARGYATFLSNPILQLDGSSLLHPRIQRLGARSQLHSFATLGHDLTDTSTTNFIIQKTAEFFYATLTSLKTLEHSPLSLRAYPNPAQDQMTVELGGSFSGLGTSRDGIRYQITDAYGRCWSQGNWNDPQQPLPLDLSSAAPGVYMLKVRDAKGRGAELRLVKRP